MHESTKKLTIKQAIKRFFTRYDWYLVIVALVGLLILAIVTPYVQDATDLNSRVDEEQAISDATEFLSTIGYGISNHESRAYVNRRTSILNSLNQDFSKDEIQQAYELNPGLGIPTYYYSVVFKPIGSNALNLSEIADIVTAGDEENAAKLVTGGFFEQVTVELDLLGKPIGFNITGINDSSSTSINYNAYINALGVQIPDSINSEQIGFRGRSDNENLESEDEPLYTITRDQSEQLAKYYLKNMYWGLAQFDSLANGKTVEIDDDSRATFTYYSENQILNRILELRISVDVLGNLHSISSEYVDGERNRIVFSRNRISETTGIWILVLLIGIALIVLIRRFSRGLLDAQPSKIDALFGAIALFIFLVLNNTGVLARDEPLGFLQILSMIAPAFFGSLGGWVLIFFLSVYASSLSHEVWPQKLKQINLIRKGYLVNQPVGMTLIRSVLYGVSLAAIMTAFALLLPIKGILWTESRVFLSDQVLLSSIHLIASSIFSLILIMFILLLGVAAIAHRRFKSAWVTIGIITIFWAVSGLIAIDFIDQTSTILLLLVVGVSMGFIFWRHGPVLALLTFLVAEIMWIFFGGIYISGNPDLLNLLVLGLFPVGLIVFGLVGIKSDITSEELPDYTPLYLVELANRERMVQELKIARQVQLSFLPDSTPEIPGLEIAANCFAATEVGGDYYDFQLYPDQKFGVVIGDVSGKGIQAAFFMTLIKGFTKSLADGFREPNKFLPRINSLFYDNSKRGTFISMIYGLFDVQNRTFRFARAGHNPLILVKSSSKKAEMIDSRGLAIGMISDARFDDTLESVDLALEAGDMIILYTDGYTEAMSQSHKLYGDDRLLNVVRKNIGSSAKKMLEAINSDVRTFTGATVQSDDMTMVIIRVSPDGLMG